ncbi:hypothetical protein C6499_21405 [Candidatus Poribacteria bacterium]|nr:MAG: hypothetical protein C6499_21405 [Candidatus Poribacteria bacterium]
MLPEQEVTLKRQNLVKKCPDRCRSKRIGQNDFCVRIPPRFRGLCIYQCRRDYNSAEYFQEVASGEGNEVTVTNEDFFELFMPDIRNGGA